MTYFITCKSQEILMEFSKYDFSQIITYQIK